VEPAASVLGDAVEVAGVRKEAVRLGATTVTRATYPTGWRHADHDPEPCALTHTGYCLAGQLRVWWPDGTEVLVEGGHAFALPPGHDAACLEECTLIQFDHEGA
jgi:quercetin dioxygenase-like cupin family protein